MIPYDRLREEAIQNFELLLNYWNIEYQKISPVEYDFKNPAREDNNYGACRFNTQKGKGADFAGRAFGEADFNEVSDGLSRDDFNSTSEDSKNDANWGFDIIGLTQRVHKCPSYRIAAELLYENIRAIRGNKGFIAATQEAIERRKTGEKAAREKLERVSKLIWNNHKKFKGTVGEQYLLNRDIVLGDEPNVGFHPRVFCKELNDHIPALIFKVAMSPEGEQMAIHRIYLTEHGTKAPLKNSKAALGSIKGCGIWLGQPGPILAVAEGPETALQLREMYPFVVCTINAINFSSLTIPSYVKHVILIPDQDEAGLKAEKKAKVLYARQGKTVETDLL